MLAKVIIENGQKKIQALTADTGTGAPVGSIIVVCSNILPSGYLGLGVQYDITNYPALYQVLGTDTTPTASALGLPTLSSGQYAIKATSGLTENQQENVLNTINENNSYSTEEHPTGKKWIDGKPVYKKTWTGTTSIDGWNVIANLAALNISKVVNAEQVYEEEAYIQGHYFASNTNRWRIIIRKSDMALIVDAINNAEYVITLEYTKTTD